MKKEKIRFERISLVNRWKQRSYSRNGDWVIVGIHQRYASYDSFCIKLCFFGLDLQIWFKKKFIS